jgi:hypothetical protein
LRTLGPRLSYLGKHIRPFNSTIADLETLW